MSNTYHRPQVQDNAFLVRARQRKVTRQIVQERNRQRNAAVKAAVPELTVSIGARVAQQVQESELVVNWVPFYARTIRAFRQHGFRTAATHSQGTSLCGRVHYADRATREVPASSPKCLNCEKAENKLREGR